MERDLKNKVVVITGGIGGIGYHIVDSFLKNGAQTVIILDIAETNSADVVKKLNGAYGEGKAVFMKCDVTKDLEAVSSEILSKYKVDVFVNNAGILNETLLRKTIEINTIGVMEWGMKFWEYMRKDKGGSGGTIINIASIYGFEFVPWLVYYVTSKHAVIGFTKSLGHSFNYELTGVRVFGICPGFTDTPILQGQMFDCHREPLQAFLEKQYLQKPEIVGEAAVEMFKIADSGTAWVVRDGQPIEQARV